MPHHRSTLPSWLRRRMRSRPMCRAPPSSTPSAEAGCRIRSTALATYARVLAGESLSYTDEVEQCYGVRPQLGSEAAYSEAHEQLEDLLPGDGSLHERYEAYRREHAVEPARMVPALRALIAVLRIRMGALVELPDGRAARRRGGARRALVGVQLLPGRSRAAGSSSTRTSRRPQQTSSRSPRTRPTRATTPNTPSRSSCSFVTRAFWRSRSSSYRRLSRSSARASPSSGLEVVMDDELKRELETTLRPTASTEISPGRSRSVAPVSPSAGSASTSR